MRTHARTVAPLLAATVLLAAPAAAGAATKTVQAGPFGSAAKKFRAATADANAYFRKRVTIRRGDRVSWRINGFHSVTFVPPGGQAPGLVAPDADNPVTGVNDAAGLPFWFNGQPRLLLNPEAAFPAGGRTFSRSRLVNSGLPLQDGPAKPYRLRFNRTGTFRYLCVVHPGMKGTVKVVARGRRVPSARADRREARREQRIMLQRVRRLTSGVGFTQPDKVIQAGNDRRSGEEIFKFFPASPSFRVGDTVTLRMAPGSTDLHTISFGPTNGRDAYLDQLAEGFIAPAPGDGQGPPTLVFDPRAAYPSENPAAGVPAYTGTNHGNGFLNSGVLDRDAASALPPSTRVTFTAPGKFTYICLIHPFMKDTVTITP